MYQLQVWDSGEWRTLATFTDRFQAYDAEYAAEMRAGGLNRTKLFRVFASHEPQRSVSMADFD